jgi:hypothetical protein
MLDARHEELKTRLQEHNLIHIYRLREYDINAEIIIEFLLFLQNKMYEGLNINKYDLFEMIACIIDRNKSPTIESEILTNFFEEFNQNISSKGLNVELAECSSLTSCYKMQKFYIEPDVNIHRTKHILEIVRILFNQTRGMRKINKWVDYLEAIFNDLKMLIYKSII